VDATAARDAMPHREWLTEARAELGRRLS